MRIAVNSKDSLKIGTLISQECRNIFKLFILICPFILKTKTFKRKIKHASDSCFFFILWSNFWIGTLEKKSFKMKLYKASQNKKKNIYSYVKNVIPNMLLKLLKMLDYVKVWHNTHALTQVPLAKMLGKHIFIYLVWGNSQLYSEFTLDSALLDHF